MGVGARIKAFRKKARMSQGDIADALGITRQAVSRWEHEDQSPTSSKLEAIARCLNVRVEDLTGVTVYPDMSGYEHQKVISMLKAKTLYLNPVPAAALKKGDDGVWGASDEENMEGKGIPATSSMFSGKAIAVVSRGAKLKDFDIPSGAIVLIDSGTEIRPGGISLVMMFGAPKFVRVYKAGTCDYIVEYDNVRERLDAEAQIDMNFEIVGPAVEIRVQL